MFFADSDLKKEYDYLLTLKGFSAKDMNLFHIVHMYASTIEDVLLSTEQIQKSLKSIARFQGNVTHPRRPE